MRCRSGRGYRWAHFWTHFWTHSWTVPKRGVCLAVMSLLTFWVAAGIASHPVLRSHPVRSHPASSHPVRSHSIGPPSIAARSKLALVQVAHAAPARDANAGSSPCVLYAELNGIVNAGTLNYLRSAVLATQSRGCQALLVVIDTPGGTLDATREIVREFLGAKVPIITYVAPAGAHAGSAGMFITLAGHIAAMAPGTNIGAAHPVFAGGQDPEESGGSELARKLENDTAAFARAIAEKRERNVSWSEAAVRKSSSYTAHEAKRDNVIDHVAPSTRELLSTVSGETVALNGRSVRLTTTDAALVHFEMTIQQRVLAVLGNPNLAYLLLMGGLMLILIEFYAPGGFVAGALGAGALLLAAIGLNMLPVNVGGVVLLVIAVGLFVAEFYVTSFGLLALTGLVALLLGSALLLDESDPSFFADASVRLSWGLVIPLALLLAFATFALAWRGRQLRVSGQRPTDELIGIEGVTLTELREQGGQVRALGERWHAVSKAALGPGVRVRVVGRKGLTLTVVPVSIGSTRAETPSAQPKSAQPKSSERKNAPPASAQPVSSERKNAPPASAQPVSSERKNAPPASAQPVSAQPESTQPPSAGSNEPTTKNHRGNRR